jgi:hypothetical protein
MGEYAKGGVMPEAAQDMKDEFISPAERLLDAPRRERNIELSF